MTVKINIGRFTRRAYRKKKMMAAFLKKLVLTKPRGLNAAMREAEKKTWEEIDCQKCGHCCMHMTPVWKKSEIKRVSKHLGMTPAAFYEKWLYTEDGSGDVMNYTTPCQFFDKKNGLCTIYAIRPNDCATFPHLYRKDFETQQETYLLNLHRCPATLTAMEHLHTQLKPKK